ncbi:MAG TPA: hypothetical protein VGD68_17525 [Streptosporangiaceae bacterium]
MTHLLAPVNGYGHHSLDRYANVHSRPGTARPVSFTAHDEELVNFVRDGRWLVDAEAFAGAGITGVADRTGLPFPS